jgi:hypothetical protein
MTPCQKFWCQEAALAHQKCPVTRSLPHLMMVRRVAVACALTVVIFGQSGKTQELANTSMPPWERIPTPTRVRDFFQDKPKDRYREFDSRAGRWGGLRGFIGGSVLFATFSRLTDRRTDEPFGFCLRP